MIDQEVFPTFIESPELAVGVFQKHIMSDHAGSSIIAEMMRRRFDLNSKALTWINESSYSWDILDAQIFGLGEALYLSKALSLGRALPLSIENMGLDVTSLLRALLKAGIDIHPLGVFGDTPLFDIISSYFYDYRERCIEILPMLLSAWFGLLRETGHDIQKYLCRESQIWSQINDARSSHRRAIFEIHIERYVNSSDLTFSLQNWDLQDAVRLNWKPSPKHDLPGAWIDPKAEQKEFKTWFTDFLQKHGRPHWAPDFEM
jgi:hypothetical protein